MLASKKEIIYTLKMSPKEKLNAFFLLAASSQAMRPLSSGICFSFEVENQFFTLEKNNQNIQLQEGKPPNPEMSFTLSEEALSLLLETPYEEVGDLGVKILELLVHSDPKMRMQIKVHLGPFDLFRKGYFNVLPLGGKKVMQFLSSKGFSSLGKIKEGISKLRQ